MTTQGIGIPSDKGEPDRLAWTIFLLATIVDR